VPLTEDEQVIEALTAKGPHEPLRERVRPRRSDGRLDDPHTIGSEYLIEGSGEPAITVPDEKPEYAGAFTQVHQQIPGLLSGPGAARVGGDAQDVHAALLDLHDEQHVQALEEHGVDVCEVACQDAGGLRGQELPPGR
jgi:hypothetical protein